MDASKQQIADRDDVDIAIAGGGLAGALIAWRLHRFNPDLKILVVERGHSLGYGGGYGGGHDGSNGGRPEGGHTWSFHATDVSPDMLAWLSPLIRYRWPGQSVRFPKLQRTLTTPYCSITSEQLAKIVEPDLKSQIIYGQQIEHVGGEKITLADGKSIKARAVIDCRGQQGNPHLSLGFQKFVGQEIKFDKPHGLIHPIIMDADVPQYDGYRFLYVLPFDEHTALVEDTRYADGAVLDNVQIRKDIMSYIDVRGFGKGQLVREEEGVLPIALAGDIEKFWRHSGQAISTDNGYLGQRDDSALAGRAGMSAALFHPLTGYSLPFAATLAQKISDHIQDHKDFTAEDIFHLTHSYSVQHWQDMGFYRLLCRMLFRAARPDKRYKVLERFYKFPQPLIERFYAGASRKRDKMRILTGKPPVPIHKAMACLADK